MLQANNASLISIVYNNLFILLKNIFFFYYILRCIIHRSITYYKLHPSSIPQSILSSPPHPMPNFNFYIPLLCSMYISHTVRCSLAMHIQHDRLSKKWVHGEDWLETSNSQTILFGDTNPIFLTNLYLYSILKSLFVHAIFHTHWPPIVDYTFEFYHQKSVECNAL